MTGNLETQATRAAEEAARLAQEAAAARQASEEAAAKVAAQQQAKRTRRLERFVADFDPQALSQVVTDAMHAFEAAVAEGEWADVFGAFDRYQQARVQQITALQTYNSARVQLGHESQQLNIPTRMAELVPTLELALGKRAQRLFADAHDEWNAKAQGE